MIAYLGGRRPRLSDNAKRTAMAAETLYKAGDHSVSEVVNNLEYRGPLFIVI